MSDPVQSFFDILDHYKLRLSGLDNSFEEGNVSPKLREQLKNDAKRQFEERKAELSASLPPVTGHSGALDAGHPPSTSSLPPPASTAAPASDAHLGATPSAPKTRLGFGLTSSVATAPFVSTSVATAPVVSTPVASAHVASAHVASAHVASGRSVPRPIPVTPDVDHSPRPKRARSVPQDVDALIHAQKVLIERFKWKKQAQILPGPTFRYINPRGNCNNKSVKTEDLKLGEDFFFDVQEALKYAETHQNV